MASSMKLSSSRPWVAAALLLLTLAAYGPALDAGYIWDDDAYVTANRTLRSTEGLASIWFEPIATPQYYPMVFTSFWVELRLWGLTPFGYHLDNVLLHALACFLVWRVLVRLGLPGAMMAAAFFAVHPVMVESVAWITERKNVLSGVFYLSSMLAYFRFSPPDRDDRDSGEKRFYLLSLLLFAFALLSKTVTCTLPAAILVIEWWKRGHLLRSGVVRLLPMFVLGAAAGLHTAYFEVTDVGAKGPGWDLSAVERCLIAGRAAWFYLAKLAWPHPLSFNYPRWRIDPGAGWQYLFPIAATGAVLALWFLRRRIGRGPLAAALFFGGTLFPALGFFNTYPMRYSFVADHFQYLASLGPIALASALGTTFLSHPRRRRLAQPVAAILLLILGILCVKQASIYADTETLWRDTLRKNPESAIANIYVGGFLLKRGEADAASEYFREAIRIADFHEAHNHLGKALQMQGAFDEAMAEFQRAVDMNPDRADYLNNLGAALVHQGKFFQAEVTLHRALQLEPLYAPTYSNLGVLLARQGNFTEAVSYFERALRLQPDFASAYNSLGEVLLERREFERAADAFEQTLRIEPDNPRARENLTRARRVNVGR
jgi:Tfp pilus assembly protein PilF